MEQMMKDTEGLNKKWTIKKLCVMGKTPGEINSLCVEKFGKNQRGEENYLKAVAFYRSELRKEGFGDKLSVSQRGGRGSKEAMMEMLRSL